MEIKAKAEKNYKLTAETRQSQNWRWTVEILSRNSRISKTFKEITSISTPKTRQILNSLEVHVPISHRMNEIMNNFQVKIMRTHTKFYQPWSLQKNVTQVFLSHQLVINTLFGGSKKLVPIKLPSRNRPWPPSSKRCQGYKKKLPIHQAIFFQPFSRYFLKLFFRHFEWIPSNSQNLSDLI